MKPEDIIIAPIVTEKSNDDMQIGKYTFKVAKKATKIDIKNCIIKTNYLNALCKIRVDRNIMIGYTTPMEVICP